MACVSTWIHGVCLPSVLMSKTWSYFEVANCWTRWLAGRVCPDRWNPLPLHAYSSKPYACVADLENRLSDAEIRTMVPGGINLMTNEEYRARNPHARAGRDPTVNSRNDPANRPIHGGWTWARENNMV